MADPFAILGLSADASTEQVRVRWRELLHLHHPDVGGSVPEFIELRQAYSECLDLAANRKCPHCHGSGYRTAGAGGLSLKVRCGCSHE